MNPPTISISDLSILEGASTALTSAIGGFTVTLSAASTLPITVDYATASGTGTASTFTTVSNTTGMLLPATNTSGPADPYPSTITVPTTTTMLSGLTVTLAGFSHTFPNDIDVLLQGPTGATVLLMSDVGGFTEAVNVTLTFNDTGPALGAPVGSGTYRPTNTGIVDALPKPGAQPAVERHIVGVRWDRPHGNVEPVYQR